MEATTDEGFDKSVRDFCRNFKAPEWFKPAPEGMVAFGKTVMIRKEKRKEMVSKGGIIMPETQTSTTSLAPVGRIVAVGPDVRWMKPGMRVVVNIYSNLETFYDGESYVAMYETDIKHTIPEDAVTTTEQKPVPKKEIDPDLIPDNSMSKEEIQERQEFADETADKLKDLSRRGKI